MSNQIFKEEICEGCTTYDPDSDKCSGMWEIEQDGERDRWIKCIQRQEYGLRQRSDALLKSSRLSPRFAVRTFYTFKETPHTAEALRACRAWCDADHSDGVGLGMNGPVGTGKTHLGAAILNDWMKRGNMGVFVVMSDFFGELRSAMQNKGTSTDEIIDRIAKAPLLVMDDMGVDKTSDWQATAIYRIINQRYEHFLPTIITTNLDHEEMPKALGNRTYDRLLESCDWHEVKGNSYRRNIAKERT